MADLPLEDWTQKGTYECKFEGGPEDGMTFWFPEAFPQFGFVAKDKDGKEYNWSYRLQEDCGWPLRYRFVGAMPI